MVKIFHERYRLNGNSSACIYAAPGLVKLFTYTPNSEWLDLFFSGLDNVKNGSTTVDDYIADVLPDMQASLDQAWADADANAAAASESAAE